MEFWSQFWASVFGALVGGGVAALIAWRVFISERKASVKDREIERQSVAADRSEARHRRSLERAQERDLQAKDREAERVHARSMRDEEQAAATRDRYSERVHTAAEPLLETLARMMTVDAHAEGSLPLLMNMQARVSILQALLRGEDKFVGDWLAYELGDGTRLLRISLEAGNGKSKRAVDAAAAAREWVVVVLALLTTWLRDRPEISQQLRDRRQALLADQASEG